jgi:hypothetical protein
MVFALPLNLDKFRVVLASGRAQLPQFNSCTVINLWVPYSLYRDTAPVPAISFVTGDKLAAPINLVPRSGSNSTKLTA